MTTLSILDLVFINKGSSPKEALENSGKLAKRAEELGYNRLWVAEHHNMPAIASAATAVVVGYLASQTKTIRLGAGGIMLPNHSPLIIAEQFGTLASLYPDRIDLGLGRAPGTDQKTMRALRRDHTSSNTFPDDVQELQSYFAEPTDQTKIKAIPGSGLNVPLWILGSSTFGAQLAAHLGLPFAFASHFAPDSLMDAIAIYRQNFKPSKQLKKPYVMIGVNIVAAENVAQAKYLFTSVQQSFANLNRQTRGPFPPPIDDIESYWSPEEKVMASHMLSYAVVGSEETVATGLKNIIQKTQADELMVVSSIYDVDARIRSFELIKAASLQ